jgi:hypothetical protein
MEGEWMHPMEMSPGHQEVLGAQPLAQHITRELHGFICFRSHCDQELAKKTLRNLERLLWEEKLRDSVYSLLWVSYQSEFQVFSSGA